MPFVYPLTVDGAKIGLAVNDQGQLVLAPSGSIGLSGPVDSHVFGYNGSTWENAGLDRITRTLQTITYAHHEIHSGSSFTCNYQQMVSDTNDRTIITFRTPNTTRWLHMVAFGSASALGQFKITRGPTVTDNTGATLAIFNRDENSTNTSDVWDTSQNPDAQGAATFFTEATMGNVTGGTVIYSETIGGAGLGNRTVAGQTRGISEIILKQNTLYAFEMISLNDNDNYHHVVLDWYEHVNK
jgi:hypothetical protein